MTSFFSTNWFDLAIYVCLFVAVVMGFMTGLLRSLATIFGYIAGMGVAVVAAPRVTPLLTTHLKMPTLQTWIVIVAIFVAAGAVLSLLLRLALNEMVGPNISVPDRVAGAALGALRIALLAIMLVVVFDRTIPPGQEPAFLKNSQWRPVLSSAAQRAPAPPAARGRGLYRPPEAPPPPVNADGGVRVAARPSCPVPLNLFVSWHDPCPDQRVYFHGWRKGRAMSSKGLSKRTAKGFEEILNAARAAGLTGPPSEPGTPGHTALYYLALNDPVMSAAMQSARESLPGFLALARHPGPTMERFAVKIALLGDAGPEFFWIYPFAHVGDRFIGQIGNTPLTLAGPKKGGTITFVSTGCTRTPA